MARGDVKWFNAGIDALGQKLFDMDTDVWALGICNNAPVPTMNTADPRWGAGGTTNFASNQVATGTGYTGPITLGSPTWAITANVPTFDANDVVIAQDASTGFANGAYGIIYNQSAANRAIGFLDLGGPIGNANGPITITWNAAGILTDVAI